MSQLTTFVKPTPQPLVMNMLVHVNRWLNLKGTSLLKWIPLVNKMPFIRGFCDITNIQFSKEDENRLRSYIHADSVAFIGPNHPEFYTDWMLDKEISARAAPLMASWATHEVVNGMGKTMQKFWLKNNLIAQIPGTGNKEAKDYSIEHAIAGHGVLLHPEGHVGWHSDKIAPLFSGIFDMAYQAYTQTEGKKHVYMIPVIWKLSFNKNVSKELHKEFDYVEKQLSLDSSKGLELNERIYQVFYSIFHNVSMKWNIHLNTQQIVGIQKQLVEQLSSMTAQALGYTQTNEIDVDIKNMNKLVKNHTHDNVKQVKAMLKDISNVHDFTFDYYSETISQENIAELLQKIRIRFCTKGFRNIFHKFVPIPVSSRTAYIEVPEAVCVNDIMEHSKNKEYALQLMQERMQSTLDSMNQKLVAQGKVISYKNLMN